MPGDFPICINLYKKGMQIGNQVGFYANFCDMTAID